MVGIGGGVPSEENDIRLGDVVVSQPVDSYGGVIQYDMGRTEGFNQFVRTGSLNRPPNILLGAINGTLFQNFAFTVASARVLETTPEATTLAIDSEHSPYISHHPSGGFANLKVCAELQARHLMMDAELWDNLKRMQSKNPIWKKPQQDQLYRVDYRHPADERTCASCDRTQLVPRSPRIEETPSIHYGLIASGNRVMKDGVTREKFRKELNVLCFETVAAGLMDTFPCIVIRGICDYSDSHKNYQWQRYAAAVAAAYAKELLCSIAPTQTAPAQALMGE
jgi:nucleoside phosphorylase